MADFAALLRAAAEVHKETRPPAHSPPPSAPSADALPDSPLSVFSPPRASPPPRIWSGEQEEALAANDPRLLVSALAGAGKTSVLLEYARRRPQRSWTLLTLNASVARTVAAIAPPGLTVRTLHSLAFAHHGAPIAHKLLPDMPTWPRLAAHVSLPWADRHAIWSTVRAAYGRSLMDGLLHFSHNADSRLGFAVCDPMAWSALLNRYPDVSWDPAGWCEDAISIWRSMLDPHSSCPTGHDVYLKRFCLAAESWPKASWLLDEAQDWPDGVRMAWDRHVDHGVRAGDPFQAIYTWRTASTCPWEFPGEKVVWLHQSRRQGPGVAPWINNRLFSLTGSHRWAGNDHLSTQVVLNEETADGLRAVQPNAILSGHWSALADLVPSLLSAGLSPLWSSGAPEVIRHRAPDVPVLLADSEEPIPHTSSRVLLSTIHAAKGAEYDRVWIIDEALSAHEHPDDLAMPNRLAYVALTRGRSIVRVPQGWPHAPNSDESEVSDPFGS